MSMFSVMIFTKCYVKKMEYGGKRGVNPFEVEMTGGESRRVVDKTVTIGMDMLVGEIWPK